MYLTHSLTGQMCVAVHDRLQVHLSISCSLAGPARCRTGSLSFHSSWDAHLVDRNGSQALCMPGGAAPSTHLKALCSGQTPAPRAARGLMTPWRRRSLSGAQPTISSNAPVHAPSYATHMTCLLSLSSDAPCLRFPWPTSHTCWPFHAAGRRQWFVYTVRTMLALSTRS